jgi:hypothetical protein
MDVLLIRRRKLTDSPAPFRCCCGELVKGWALPHQAVGRCASCGTIEYHVLRSEVTADKLAREFVIGARGVEQDDLPAFERQGFHTTIPTGARFALDGPRILNDMTNWDGSLKSARNPH